MKRNEAIALIEQVIWELIQENKGDPLPTTNAYKRGKVVAFTKAMDIIKHLE